MDEYWERQGPLPADERMLCRLIGCFPDEWAEVRDNVISFFEERDGQLFHKRIDEEITKAVETYEAKRERIAKARAAKAAKDKAVDSAVNKADDKPVKQTPSPAPSPTHILTDTEEPREGAPDGAPPSKQTRLSKDFQPPPDWIADAMTRGKLTEEEVFEEWENFHGYWNNERGKKGLKSDWKRTWLNFVTGDICQNRVGARRRNAKSSKTAGVVGVVQHVRNNPPAGYGARRE